MKEIRLKRLSLRDFQIEEVDMNGYYRRPSFVARFCRIFDWEVVMAYSCWLAMIAIFVYLGIFVFGPFTLKLVGWI